MVNLSPEDRTRGCLALIFVFLSYRSLDYSNIAALFFIISWIFYVFSRYYFNLLAWPLTIRFIAGFLYGFMLIYLMMESYSGLDEGFTILAGFSATISMWFLLLNWSDFVMLIFGVRP